MYNTYTCEYILGPPRLLASFTRRWIRLSNRSRPIMAPMLKVCTHIYKYNFLHDMTHWWAWFIRGHGLRFGSIMAPTLNICIHIFIFWFIRDMTNSYVCICICIAVYSWSDWFVCIYMFFHSFLFVTGLTRGINYGPDLKVMHSYLYILVLVLVRGMIRS